jgi:hypothetical protein
MQLWAIRHVTRSGIVFDGKSTIPIFKAKTQQGM